APTAIPIAATPTAIPIAAAPITAAPAAHSAAGEATSRGCEKATAATTTVKRPGCGHRGDERRRNKRQKQRFLIHKDCREFSLIRHLKASKVVRFRDAMRSVLTFWQNKFIGHVQLPHLAG